MEAPNRFDLGLQLRFPARIALAGGIPVTEGARRDPRDGSFYRGTFRDKSKADAKAAECGGWVVTWWSKKKKAPRYTVKSQTLDGRG